VKVCTAMADRADQKLGAGERRISKLAAAAGLIDGLAELPVDRTRFQGQEFGENYTLPLQGIGRTLLLRPVRWDYFYDTFGQNLVHLVRALLQIRRSLPQLRTGPQYFYNDASYAAQHLVLFSRGTGSQFSLIAVNLSDTDALTNFTFPQAGVYQEQLERGLGYPHPQDLTAVNGAPTAFRVPSNYGGVWTAA
jgi:maltooligosyltrehalose trehalohydrolase